MPQDHKKELIDNATKMYLGSDAMSRFTRTPIEFHDLGSSLQRFKDLGFRDAYIEGRDPDEPATGGSYAESPRHPKGKIDVTSYKFPSQWEDVMSALHHEDIHSTINKARIMDKELNFKPSYNFFGQPDSRTQLFDRLLGLFRKAERAGYPPRELPAYLGAHTPGEIPGLNQKDIADYMSELFKIVPTNTAEQIIRIMQSHRASQNPPFYTGK